MSDDNTLTPLAAQRQISFLTTFDKKFEGFRREMDRLERAVLSADTHAGQWPTEGLERIARSLVGAGAVYGLPTVTDWARGFLELLDEVRTRKDPPDRLDLAWLAGRITDLTDLREELRIRAEEIVEPGSSERRRQQEREAEEASKSMPSGEARATPAPFIAPARATDPPPPLTAATKSSIPPVRHTPIPKLERVSMRPAALVVSADNPVREAVTKALSEAGFDVCQTSVAERALDRATEDAPDLVVLDIGDPAPGGATLALELNRDPLTEFIPVVQIADDADQTHGNTIPKPVDTERLATEARRLAGLDLQSTRIAIGLKDPNLAELVDFVIDEIHDGVSRAVTGSNTTQRIRVLREGQLMASIWGLVAQLRRLAAVGSNGRIRFIPTSSGRAGIMALAEAEEVLDPATHQELDDTALADLEGLNVLVADDDAEIRVIFDRVLTDAGMRVRTAVDGLTALKAIREAPPDVLITDILMPGLDGWELCNRLRSDYALRHIPVIILSWKEDFLERLRGLNMGADDFMLKRVDRQQILGRIARVIRPRIVLQNQLASTGSMSGRVERVGVRTLIETTTAQRPNCRIVMRETWNYFEADIRGGELIAVTCTAADGSFISGPPALERLLGVSNGRFSVVEAEDTPKHQFDQGTAAAIKRASDQLNQYVAQIIDGALLDITKVDLFDEVLELCSPVMPPKLRTPLELLRNGDSPREIILSGTASPDALETLLLDLIRVGAIRAIVAPPPDMTRAPVARDSEHWRAIADGVLPPEDVKSVAAAEPALANRVVLAPKIDTAASATPDLTNLRGPVHNAPAPVKPPDERLVSRTWQVLAMIAVIALGLSLYLNFNMWDRVKQATAQARVSFPNPRTVSPNAPPAPIRSPATDPPQPLSTASPRQILPLPVVPPIEPAVDEETEPVKPEKHPWGETKKKRKKRKHASDKSDIGSAASAGTPANDSSAKKKEAAPKQKEDEPTPTGKRGTLVIAANANAPGPIAVAVDGKPRGSAPLKIKLKPGLHEVVFTVEGKRTLRMVNIKVGETKSIKAAVP